LSEEVGPALYLFICEGGVSSTNAAIPAGRAPSKGERTRETILRAAADLASREGLERLTIGRLANELGMSKSGLYAHFRSKRALQLATIEAAREVFVEEVVRPAMGEPEGLGRLWALCDGFISYLEREVFPGGCFFAGAQAELDACPGPLRDQVAFLGRQWLGRLEAEVRAAQELGELDAGLDPGQLAFELEAMMFFANSARLLHPDAGIPRRARIGMADRLRKGP